MDPQKDHTSHKDPNEEKDDTSSPMIILEDSNDKEAPDEELIRVLQPLFIELSLADGSSRRTHGIVEDVIMKVKNCYSLVDFIIVDMKIMKDFTNAPIILGTPFIATTKAITDWGKGEVIFHVGDSMMKVSINKLMGHPSHASDEVGSINIYEDSNIGSFIEEMMAFIEEVSIKEPQDDPFPLSDTTPELKALPSSLKYSFLDHQHAQPMIISS